MVSDFSINHSITAYLSAGAQEDRKTRPWFIILIIVLGWPAPTFRHLPHMLILPGSKQPSCCSDCKDINPVISTVTHFIILYHVKFNRGFDGQIWVAECNVLLRLVVATGCLPSNTTTFNFFEFRNSQKVSFFNVRNLVYVFLTVYISSNNLLFLFLNKL